MFGIPETGETTEKITDHNSVVVLAKGHTAVQDAGVSATCTTDGKTYGSHSSICGEVLEEQHIIYATGHTVVEDPGKEATCVENGLTKGSHCSICGDVIEIQQAIEATGHRYDDYTYEANDHWQVCKICGEKSVVCDHSIVITIENDKYFIRCECGYTATEDIKKEIRVTGDELAFSPDVVFYNRDTGDGSLTVNFDDRVTITYDKDALTSIATTIGSGNITLKADIVNMEAATLNDNQKKALEDIPAGSVLFDVMLKADGVAIHDFGTGKATISMPFTLPEKWRADEVSVYRIEEDGSKTLMKTEYKDGKIIWETNGHSYYLATKFEESEGTENWFDVILAMISVFNTEISTWIPAIAIIVILLIIVIVAASTNKKRK